MSWEIKTLLCFVYNNQILIHLNFLCIQEQYQKLMEVLTDDEKKNPENGEKAINVLKWWATSEQEKKAGEHKAHFIREEVITLQSVTDNISKFI